MSYHYHVVSCHYILFVECDLSPASINRVGRILGDGKLPNLIALDMSCESIHIN